MKSLYFVIALVLLAPACSKIQNNIRNIDIECGVKAEPGVRYVKLESRLSPITSKTEFTIRDANQRDWTSLITDKACVSLPEGFDSQLVILRPGTGEGLLLSPARLSDSMQVESLRTYSYSSLKSDCKATIATNRQDMAWPIHWEGVDSAAYEWRLNLAQGPNAVLSLKHHADENLGSEKIDLSKVQDGRYKLSIEAQQIFTKDQPATRFECEFIVDRQAPVASTSARLTLVDESTTPFVQAAPGEAIRVQSDGGASADQLMSCLVPEGKESECRFSPTNAGYVTAPDKGAWILFLYAVDAAGNKSETKQYSVQIYDAKQVAVIRSYAGRASMEQKNGHYQEASLLGAKAYEEMRNLGSPLERKDVESFVREILVESSLQAMDLVTLTKRNNMLLTEGPGLKSDREGNLLLLEADQGPLQAYTMDGMLAWTFDLRNLSAVHYCERTAGILFLEKNTLKIVKHGVPSTLFTFSGEEKNTAFYPTKDCRFITTSSRRVDGTNLWQIIDLANSNVIETSSLHFIVGLLNQNDPDKLLEGHSIFDTKSQTSMDLAAFLKIPPIKLLIQSQDGTTAVLSNDDRLRFVTRDGVLSPEVYNQVEYISTTEAPGEFFLEDKNGLKSIIAAGKPMSILASELPKLSTLQANSEFIVGQMRDVNSVQIWSRRGDYFGEVTRSKKDSIQSFSITQNNELYIESEKYHQIIQLNTGLSRRYLPEFHDVSGLKFSKDSDRLFIKEQDFDPPVALPYPSALRSWSLSQGDIRTIDIKPRPSDIDAFADSIEIFQDGDREFLTISTDQSDIAIYASDQFKEPIAEYSLKGKGFRDIAISPDHKYIAAATDIMDGSFFVINRETKAHATINISRSVRELIGQYPTSLTFDRSSRNIFVADNNFNLMAFTINETNDGRITLVPRDRILKAGNLLSRNGTRDEIAVVSDHGKLKIFSLDFKDVQEYSLASESVDGTSITYAPNGEVIYAGFSDGSIATFDIKTKQITKARFSSAEIPATNIAISPDFTKLAFYAGGLVHVVDNNVDKLYQNICTWMRPRIKNIRDLDPDLTTVCSIKPQ